MLIEPAVIVCHLPRRDQLVNICAGVFAVDVLGCAGRIAVIIRKAGVDQIVRKGIRTLDVFRCRKRNHGTHIGRGGTEIHQICALRAVRVDIIRIPEHIRRPDRKSAFTVLQILTRPCKRRFQIAGQITEDSVVRPRIAVREDLPVLQVL